MKTTSKCKNAAFTLTEAVIVVVVIGILCGALMAGLRQARARPWARRAGRVLSSTHQPQQPPVFWVGGPGYGFHRLEGNLSFAVGSVQQATSAVLQNCLSNAGTYYGWGSATSNGFGASVFLVP